ncbi:hypothetical protein BSKO_06387 [Bryopsis sp. KO-2023]|nr:hypothetical protein BSKO_06387 [Bryopsis sp. KO-2023]
MIGNCRSRLEAARKLQTDLTEQPKCCCQSPFPTAPTPANTVFFFVLPSSKIDTMRAIKATAVSVLVVLILAVSVMLLAASLKKLKSTQVGLEYDTQERELGSIKGEGLHAGPPFFEFLKYSSVFLSREISTICVSRDGLVLELKVSFQYRPDPKKIEEITTKYRNSKRYDQMVLGAAESAIHHGCGDFEIEEFQSKRGIIQARQKEVMEEIFSGKNEQTNLHAEVVDVQFLNISPPSRWEEAVESKENAREEISLARKEETQALTKAETSLKVSEEEAKIVLAKAETQAEVLLNQAEAEAASLLFKFEKEANATKFAKEQLDLDTAGILRYLLNRQIESKDKIEIGMDPPSLSFNDEL